MQVHVIQRGDTLWDLASRFYGNPYLWPQVWEKNQYILDAHWIYPGDPLVLGLEVAPVDTLAEQVEGIGGEEDPEDIGIPQDGDVLTPEQAAGDPHPPRGRDDIYCSGFIGEPGRAVRATPSSARSTSRSAPTSTSSRATRFRGRYGQVGTAKYNLSTGDIVYLDGGRARGLSPGTLFTVIEPRRQVVHPITRQVAGRFYHYLGRIRVLSVQEETAIGEIVHSCDPILVGQQLQPFVREPVPLGRPSALRPVNYPEPERSCGTTPSSSSRRTTSSPWPRTTSSTSTGARTTNVTPGDMFTIYRKNRAGLPPIVVGELAVLSVHKSSSVARILESRYAVFVGDWLTPK